MLLAHDVVAGALSDGDGLLCGHHAGALLGAAALLAAAAFGHEE